MISKILMYRHPPTSFVLSTGKGMFFKEFLYINNLNITISTQFVHGNRLQYSGRFSNIFILEGDCKCEGLLLFY
ncbi:MAG: hypothetical protein K0S01_1367 [Herbinix sp.]|jgi:hypothetical protein|nr:hypothetical protein [Herbinix sp.]